MSKKLKPIIDALEQTIITDKLNKDSSNLYDTIELSEDII